MEENFYRFFSLQEKIFTKERELRCYGENYKYFTSLRFLYGKLCNSKYLRPYLLYYSPSVKFQALSFNSALEKRISNHLNSVYARK